MHRGGCAFNAPERFVLGLSDALAKLSSGWVELPSTALAGCVNIWTEVVSSKLRFCGWKVFHRKAKTHCVVTAAIPIFWLFINGIGKAEDGHPEGKPVLDSSNVAHRRGAHESQLGGEFNLKIV